MTMIVSWLCFFSNANASSLIGNPTLRLPGWQGEEVVAAPVAGLQWRFVSATGAVQTVQSGPCDLRFGCTVGAPFMVWSEVRVYVPGATWVETRHFEVELSGSLVTWVDAGAPAGWQGPPEDAGLLGARLWLPQ